MIKKLVSAAIGAGLVLATVVPAFAVGGNLCANQTTGASSFNVCTRTVDKFKGLELKNFGTIYHSLNATSNSGNNTANNNTGNSTTGGGSVTTGNLTHDTTKLASLNTVNATINQTDTATDEQGLNDSTGDSSNNTVTFTTTKNITVNVTNNGTVNQTAYSTANSGNNSANSNTLGGSVTTGDVAHTVSIISVLNDLILNITQ
ncbi:hypothetical protein HY945_01860 [Candidatus Gottesmanbacteria bacterium]|nr:hypothetical protein [Candidatus Gottesmanbacteria bacterium]